MSTATQLIRAVLAEDCPTDAAALAIIDAALLEEVDPLAWCAYRHGLGWDTVIDRAAGWAGLAAFSSVPDVAPGSVQLWRVDQLGTQRSIRMDLFGREVTFLAPRFEWLVNMAEVLERHPELQPRICLVAPPVITAALTEASRETLMDEARQRLFRRWPTASASVELTLAARIGFVFGIAVLAVLLVAAPAPLRPLVLLPTLALVVGPALLRLIAVVLPRPRIAADLHLEDAALPVYTVLVPLRDEAEMVPQLARGLADFDYPPEKLDIKFVVEERSETTVAAVRAVLGDPRFALVLVPDGAPRTKPKALDYALPLVRGEFLVIYDAEDIPDRDQLRRAAERFADDPGVDCLQAELVIDNALERPLTALFAGEYAGQFRILLPRLAAWGLPMPLGGTSNHFRVQPLRQLGGWDAFNVTEDADLGVRMSRFRHRAGVLDSRTREEAPVTMRAWLAQRTRWMKGWMQTLIVHNRHPVAFIRDIGWRGFLFVQIYVGGLILAPLLHSAFLIGVTLAALTGTFEVEDGRLLVAAIATGYGGSFAIVFAGLIRGRDWLLLPAQLLLPLYWLLHSIATVRAAIDLIVRPFHWHKTTHGRTRVVRQAAEAGAQPQVSGKAAAE